MTSRQRLTGRLTVVLGLLYLTAGVAETTRVLVTDAGGLLFWCGSLVGGGSLVLVGHALRGRPGWSCWLVVSGAMAGAMATMWTLVVPVLAASVVVLVILRTGEEIDRLEAARRSVGG